MRTVRIEKLTDAGFLSFGFFATLVDPHGDVIGAPPIQFFRDAVQQDLGGAAIASFSTCRVEPRPMVINVSEYHTKCGEGIMPLDNDVLIHVGPATPTRDVPLDKIKVFRVPRGTMVTLRPGIWHHAPLTANDKPANVLIVLPERTYANDCIVAQHSEKDCIKIEG